MAEKKQREKQQEGQALPVRREEGAISPFEERALESPFAMMRRIRDEID